MGISNSSVGRDWKLSLSHDGADWFDLGEQVLFKQTEPQPLHHRPSTQADLIQNRKARRAAESIQRRA